MAKIERVLIVGGGLAGWRAGGLALTIALRQQALSAAIVERASDWATTGAGLYLVGSATRALLRRRLLQQNRRYPVESD